jgi:protein ImuB
MCKRFVVIWFRHLKTDWMIRRHPDLKNVPFVLALPDHGRMKITEVSAAAKTKGIEAGMIVPDARIIFPSLQIFDDRPGLSHKLLTKLCLWCIRYTPITAIDSPDGLILDVSGCAHLWGSEEIYLRDIINKLKGLGYHVRAAMGDTIGVAWAVCRFGKVKAIIKTNEQAEALMPLPAAALRLNNDIIERLHKLGLYQVSSFIGMPRSVLRRRFGEELLLRLDQALGNEEEFIQPLQPVEPYQERLPCLEPIQTSTGIEIALKRLLEILCKRLQQEGKGLRAVSFRCYRIDDKIEQIAIGTNHPSNDVNHLFKLFELKISSIEPALGIELFTLQASKVENISPFQETLWTANSSLHSKELSELLDRIESKLGKDVVHRYLPDEHHLPERSIKLANSLQEKSTTQWRNDKLRPIQLLHQPESIEVTAPIPDYPPMNFRYKGKLHTVKKADGPERIESEWWLNTGLHRDYYAVEDDEGKRYWLFRLGHYEADKNPSWFIHGFFA